MQSIDFLVPALFASINLPLVQEACLRKAVLVDASESFTFRSAHFVHLELALIISAKFDHRKEITTFIET